jgi:glycosyl transferase family 25
VCAKDEVMAENSSRERCVKTSVRVLSLATDAERRASFSARAAGAKVAWSFYDAKTELTAPLRYDEQLAIVYRGRPLSATEVACYSSHYCLWGELLSSEADQLLVLEDDVLVDWGFIELVVAHDFSENGIHYLRLAATAAPPVVYRGELLGRYLVQYLGYALGCQAYIVSRHGAEFLRDYCRQILCPVDDVLDATWRGALPNFAICQAPVIGMTVPSRIGSGRNTPFRPTGILKLRRLCFRVADRLRAMIYRLKVRAGFGPAVAGVDSRWI